MMTVLWGSDTALTASEILKASTDKTWKDKSLHILINSLLKKNLIVVDGFKKMEKVYARSFKPAISQTDYIWTHLTSGLDKKKRSIITGITVTISPEAIAPCFARSSDVLWNLSFSWSSRTKALTTRIPIRFS